MLRSILPIVRGISAVTVRAYRRDGNRQPRDLAGIRIQKGVMENLDTLEEDPEITYDADFSQLHKSHSQHEKEMSLRKEQVKYYTIRSKYFKSEKLPNFLTWAEKEQIRYLNKKDPNEWTPERLSESFPAIEEVIIKVLKAKWTPANMKRVQKHDEKVKQNWDLFKANEMKELDAEVQKHLKKFSNRNFDNIQNAYVQTKIDQTTFEFPKPKSKEFFHIISSCKRSDATANEKSIDDKKKSQIEEKKGQALLSDEAKVDSVLKLPKHMRNQFLTFDELKKSSKQHLSKTEDEEMHLSVSLFKEPTSKSLPNVEEIPSKVENHVIETDTNDKADVNTYPNNKSKSDGPVNLTLADISSTKKISKYTSKPSSSLTTFNKDNSNLFRSKIQIPKRLHKHGSVYKLYDCFYDDRGEFLYRVPGLRD